MNFLQLTCFLIFYYPARFIFQPNIEGLEHIQQAKKPFIIVANHPSCIDPFLLAVLPYSIIKNMGPLAAPVAQQYYNKLWLRPFLWLFEAYPINEFGFTTEELIGSSVQKLREGYSLIIFPEGQMVKNGHRVLAKPGFIYMASYAGATIVPLKIQGVDHMSIWYLISRTYRVKLTFGEPIQAIRYFGREDYKNVAQSILEMIYSL